ncbi:similar to spore coat protein [Alteribacillus persepolensis]|uniref:Similar to spore coat protein n=1 Tax=Alteribacillus persepolensis TaxID=568899 RepID=A0A1G8EF56_9BACI|nr:spore coat protein [Alteribacillus persepolensis]SDH68506.1 similar to spore coat protein [Alteribacillus persepolensis]
MTNMLQKAAGMAGMTDQVIATDFLISAKSAVRNITFAITESATPEVREILRAQLHDAIDTHEQISQYMMKKGYYYPSDLDEQLKVEVKASKAALKLADD